MVCLGLVPLTRFLGLLFFSIHAWASSLYDTRIIDVSHDRSGVSRARVTVAGSQYAIPVSLSGRTILPEVASARPLSITFPDSGLEIFYPSLELSSAIHQIGVGPGSCLLEQVGGSIGFIRFRELFTNKLVLSISSDEFAARCSSPPLIVPLITDSSQSFATTRVSIGERIVSVGRVSFAEATSVVRLGTDEADVVGKLIISIGGEQTGAPFIFSNCGSEILDQLPVVTLVMESFGESEDSLSFNFLPREYLEIDERGRICRIISGDETRVNPFRISGMNFLVTESTVTFCNSL